MRRRLDAFRIHFIQLLDILQHLTELPAVLRDLLVAQIEPREMGDVSDLLFVDVGHGHNLRGIS